jgi:hypothetical protein
MKKAAIIFLVFVYAFSITGVAVKADYCCNHLKSIKLILADGAKDKEGCCKVKYQSFKVNDVHAAADVITAPALHLAFIETLSSFFEINNLSFDRNDQIVNIHAPPLYSSTPVYISNCVFRV